MNALFFGPPVKPEKDKDGMKLERNGKGFRFRLGQVLATPGAMAAMERSGDSFCTFLQRHQGGDWGTVCPEDARMNDDALQSGGRLFSVYSLQDGATVWIITEADRASTTALLPDEY